MLLLCLTQQSPSVQFVVTPQRSRRSKKALTGQFAMQSVSHNNLFSTSILFMMNDYERGSATTKPKRNRGFI